MKDKILFWIDVSITQFGIAKMLQKKLDADLYAIYDLNHHLKESFRDQKIVKFQKEWYFWDYVSQTSNNPDIEYLRKFEDKFKINLWEIAYSERIFYKYNMFYKFKRNEILSIFEQECKFFEKVLDEVKPHYLIIKTTDLHRNHLLTEMCRNTGVKILMLSTSRLGYKCSISSQSDRIDHFLDKKGKNNIKINSFQDLEDYLKKYKKSQQNKTIESGGKNYPLLKKIKPSIKWMIKTFDAEYKEGYDHYGVTRYRAITKYLISFLNERLRKYFIDKKFIRSIDSNEKFLFFPLQVQPERNVDIDAPYYSNQIETISSIAKALPVDYKLYVKEHPSMSLRHWRKISDYKTILNLPNVKLIHPDVEPKILLEKCSMVITIAGSAGLEAAFAKKPSIVFTDVIYSSLPSVHRLKSLEELPEAIRESLKKEVKVSDVSEFINLLDNNSFDFDFFAHNKEVLHKFHAGGFVISHKISMSELELFLEKNREIFELLASEHIKKINQYKNEIGTVHGQNFE